MKKIKTIDLERLGGTIIQVLDSGSIEEDTRYSKNYFQNKIEQCDNLEDNVGEPFLVFTTDYDCIHWNIKCEFYKESTEDYEARVQREKDLNDMYNEKLKGVQGELLKAQMKIRELEGKL